MVFLNAVEAVEDVGEVGGGDAFAVVGDVDSELFVFLADCGADVDVEGGSCVLFEGVFDDVE